MKHRCERLAERHGLRPSGVITTIGDRTVGAPFDVVPAVQYLRVADDVTVGYLRDPAHEATVRLGRRP